MSQTNGFIGVLSMLGLAMLAGCGSNSSTGLEDTPLVADLRPVDRDIAGAIHTSQTWPVHVVVQNRGGVDANAFDVAVEVRSGGALVSYGRAEVTTGLSAQSAVDVPVSMSGIHFPGLFHGVIFIDNEGTVLESNEGNNTDNFNITVNGNNKLTGDG